MKMYNSMKRSFLYLMHLNQKLTDIIVDFNTMYIFFNTDYQKHINLTTNARQPLYVASKKLGFIARSYFKVIKVTWTIADLELIADV
jgi:predicted ATPase with chaperone activity